MQRGRRRRRGSHTLHLLLLACPGRSPKTTDGSFIPFTQLIPRHRLLQWHNLGWWVPAPSSCSPPCICGVKDEGGSGEYTCMGALQWGRIRGDTDILLSPHSIPTTGPPPCGGGDWVEGLCCDNPTNGTEWDRDALPLAGTNLLQGSVVSWRAKGGDCCVLLGRAACEAMGCPPPSLFHSRVLIRRLHQPCGSCHTRERDIKGRPGCHSTCVTLGGPASS